MYEQAFLSETFANVQVKIDGVMTHRVTLIVFQIYHIPFAQILKQLINPVVGPHY